MSLAFAAASAEGTIMVASRRQDGVWGRVSPPKLTRGSGAEPQPLAIFSPFYTMPPRA